MPTPGFSASSGKVTSSNARTGEEEHRKRAEGKLVFIGLSTMNHFQSKAADCFRGCAELGEMDWNLDHLQWILPFQPDNSEGEMDLCVTNCFALIYTTRHPTHSKQYQL